MFGLYRATLDMNAILELYKSFLVKIEKGTYTWNSRATLDKIDQTLMFRALAIEKKKFKDKDQDRDKEKGAQK